MEIACLFGLIGLFIWLKLVVQFFDVKVDMSPMIENHD
jgi:hypothetical protein